MRFTRGMFSVAGRLFPDSLIGAIPLSGGASFTFLVMTAAIIGCIVLLKDSIAATPPHLVLSRTRRVSQVGWVPDSTHVAIVRQGGTVEFWDSASGEYLNGDDEVQAVSVGVYGPRPRLLLQNSSGLLTWDYEEQGTVPTPYGPPLPDGTGWIAPASSAGVCLVGMRDTPGQREYRVWTTHTTADGHISLTLAPVPTPAISGNGALVAGFIPGRGLRLFSSETGKPVTTIAVPDMTNQPELTSLHLNEDGSLLAGLAGQQLLKVHIENSNKPVAEWIDVQRPIGNMQFTSRTTMVGLVRGEEAGRVDLATGKLESWPVTTKDVDLTTVAASSDGSTIIVSGKDEKLAWIVNTFDGSVTELIPVD